MTRGQSRMRATLALIGTIIGAGIFGVPAMVGAWGVIPATVVFVLLTGLALAIHLFLAEAVLAYTPDVRLTGFARHWLGPGAGYVVGIAQALSVFGSNLAYLILGGAFFYAIAMNVGIEVPLLVWQVLFWVGGAVTVSVGLSWLLRLEAFMVWMLVAFFLLMIAVFFAKADWSVLWMARPMGSWTFEPYGVFLYSLFGYSVIAEMELVVRGNRQDLRKSVVRGVLVSALFTYLFGISAWLASGGYLGRDLSDLLALLPPWLGLVLPLAGFLAVATSFITTAFDLSSMFQLDYHFPRWMACCVGLGVPLVLLFVTERDFLATIGLVGSVFTATVAIFILFMGRAAMVRTWGKIALWSWRWWVRDVLPFVGSLLLVAGGIAWLLL